MERLRFVELHAPTQTVRRARAADRIGLFALAIVAIAFICLTLAGKPSSSVTTASQRLSSNGFLEMSDESATLLKLLLWE